MNSVAAAGNLPMSPLFRRGIRQSRKPDERHGDRPTVHELDSHSFPIDVNLLHAKVSGRFQRIHAKPPETVRDAPLPDVELHRDPWRRTRRSTLTKYSQSKIW